ncbi:uncharacterized protein LOC110866145 [Helianthus annuus]|uniref:uncharacterized protein LOC110866145 n=1 Tax=Helianthus annuus TaxID=4232 RepID=UPI001652C916|nr:uncharacterized protein LOC110866145 [Helianthus annuus]
MQQPQGSYASSNHAYSSNPPQSSSLTYPSWRSNSPHSRGYSAPKGVGFLSPQTHFTSGSGQGSYPSPGSSPHFTNRPVVQDEVTLALDPTSEIVPILPTAQVMVQDAATLVLDPTSGIASTMARVKEGTLAQVQVPGEGEAVGLDRVEGEDGAIIMYLQKTGSIVSTISQWWKDPWKFLEPVIWKSLKKQWFPPVNAKKPRVSESPRMSSSQPSLAEILVASLNEVTDDKPNAE